MNWRPWTALPVLVSLAVLGAALVGARVDLPWLPGCWFSRLTILLKILNPSIAQ